jgi:hypothetical protein
MRQGWYIKGAQAMDFCGMYFNGVPSCGLLFMLATERTAGVSREGVWQVTDRMVWDFGHWNRGMIGHRHGRI